ncbi:MAG: MATE family efflux transporter [Clostridium sp.]|nr:MATE family efflux transporter [Acetatifactor muris]MCM1528072.1 MATE family efflux transporter [Bacteroides sp.]MCM1564284.1 MATE family efflux transporter [Clostridium sp.]
MTVETTEQNTTERNFRREMLKALVTLSIPTILEEMLATLLQYVDTAMVGRLGENATAAVSVTTTVTWLIHSIPSALSVAALSLIAKAVGSGDEKRIQRLSEQVFLLAVGCGLVMSVISMALSPYIPVWMGAEESIQRQASVYFFIICMPMLFRTWNSILGAAIRATKDTRTPMLINLGANLLNVALNYLLIYTCGLGVTGAAIASAISYTLAGILMFAAYRRNRLLHWKFKGFAPDGPILKDCARISIPVLGTNVASCFGYVVFASLVTGMGNTIFAAHSIAVTAETIFYIPGYGLRTATSALVGISLGEGDRRKFETVGGLSVGLTMAMMLMSGLILYRAAYPLMCLFTNSDQVARIGAEMLKLVAFSEPFFGLMVVMEGIFYGLGRPKYTFFVETFSMWGVRIFLAFVCVRIWNLGLREVWYCMIADNVCKAVLLTLPILSSKNRKKLFPVHSCTPTESMV